MKKPEVSVIIPVYNAEKYIARTIESIQHQNFCKWELLLINDGSSDNSAEIILRYQSIDDRIHLINQQNAGPAHARNVGIRSAKGNFVCFIDSDDTIEKGMLEKLYNASIFHNADIVMCNYAIVTDCSRKEARHNLSVNQVLTNEEIQKQLLSRYFGGDNGGVASLCNKMYRLDWLRSMGFLMPENRVRAEDWLFNLNCLKSEPRFCAIDDVLYNYWQNEGSIMHTVRDGEWEQHFESMTLLQELNTQLGTHYEISIANQCVYGAISQLLSIYTNKSLSKNKIGNLLQDKDLYDALHIAAIRNLPKSYVVIAIFLKYRMYWLCKFYLFLLYKK